MELLILANGSTWDSRYQISALAASAAVSGDRVKIALLNASLAVWVRGEWDRLDPAPPFDVSRIEELGFPSLSSILDQALATGNVTIYGCSAAARFLDLDLGEVQERVDALIGWQSFSRMIAKADRVISL